MRITIRDIARLSNVSVATASMALNDKPTVNSETKRRVKEIALKCNYNPNHSARSLITHKSNCIGLIVTDICNPFFAMLVNEFNNEANKNGYSMLLGISGDKILLEQKIVEMFISKNVEGVVIVPTVDITFNFEHLYRLESLDIPFVFCTSEYNGFREPCVMTDLCEGEYQIIKHLISRGLTKIYLITANKELLISRLRLEGYIKAYQEAGLQYRTEWIIETIPDFAHGYDAAINCLGDKPDAIATINDYLAMGVLKALKDQNISVPQDISVVGYDDLLFSSIIETPLSTVRQPIGDICKKTFEILIDSINGIDKFNKMNYLEPIIKIRDSVIT